MLVNGMLSQKISQNGIINVEKLHQYFSKNASLFGYIILVLLCLASYSHALTGKYVFDDTVAIVNNADVTKETNFTAIFRHDFWGDSLLKSDSHKSFRPLTTIMFHLEWKYGMRAGYMKAVNLFLHCLNTILVWRLLRGFDSEQVAIIAAALFGIHPVHTEAVSGVVGRAELMFALFYLLSLILTKTRTLSDRPLLTDILVICFTTIGTLFKETAITIPIACIFLDYMLKAIYLQPLKRQLHLVLSLRYFVYSTVTFAIIFLRMWWQNFQFPDFKPMDNPVASSTDPLAKILSQHYLYAVNFWLLLCPNWLSFDWALGCIKLVANIWDLRLQAVLGLYSFIIVIVINRKYNFGALLGLGLLIIPFLPASGIIKVGFVIAERVLYVPSIGSCFLVAYSFVFVYSNISDEWLRKTLRGLLMLVLACYLLKTRERARDWLTEEKLFASALKVCPNNAKVHYNIARLASDNSNYEKAFQHYHKAIELYPEYESALMNLGNLYRETGDLVTAEKFITTAIQVFPEFPAAWMNLGIVQSAQKKFAEALSSYKKALKYRKKYSVCYYNMGNLFLDQKLYSEAMQHWQEAIALNPRQPKAWANILTMLDNSGLHTDVLRLSTNALEHLPNDTAITFIRANVLGKLKQYIEAEILYKHVVAAEPSNVLYYTNFGILYHRWSSESPNKLNLAIDCYQRAIELNSKKASTARNNLNKLLKRKRQEGTN